MNKTFIIAAAIALGFIVLYTVKFNRSGMSCCGSCCPLRETMEPQQTQKQSETDTLKSETTSTKN